MSSTRASVFRAAALDRLSSPEQLDERLQIVSPRAWLALAALAVLLVGGGLWAVFGRVVVRLEAAGWFAPSTHAAARVELFVPATEASRLRPGMPVEIAPLVRLDGAGIARGRVEAVTAQLATEAELLAALRDPARAQRLYRAAALKAVVAVDGAPPAAGLPCTGRIVVAEERPIAFVLPAFSRTER